MSMASVVARDQEFREQVEADARRARELTEAALDKTSDAYRFVGQDALLYAAQVYATLATRRNR